MADNKLEYGFKDIYYSKITQTDTGITWGKPVSWIGAKELKLDPTGDTTTIYADDVAYFTAAGASGYDGTLTVMQIPDQMLIDVFGYEKSSDGELVEITNATTSEVALMFEFQGDAKARRHIFYRCTLGRPSLEFATKEDKVDPKGFTLNISTSPIMVGDKEVMKATLSKGETGYDTLYTAAPTAPTFEAQASKPAGGK